ncbi:AMP-binding protein [Actinomadura madurae]|nr:AMP-binding protein [Actinomadura madurae]MCP9955198.1 AMP-binding protein [Actinomadura madurae]MCP9971934.1 AMP-binding protein [Actinomadura madurae]URN00673.1 AMP-binding protein [Actinomadura madurae]URN02823.1 AMP-binding protein [Actinomadura madurae]
MGVEGVGFYEIARNHPDRPAVLAPGVPMTYGELHAEVNRLSNALDGLGLRPGDALATVLGNRPEFLTVLLAATQSGLYLVPASRHLTAPEIGYILADSGAKAVVTESVLAGAVSGAAEEAGIPAGGRLSVDPAEGFRSTASLCASAGAGPPAERRMGSIMLYTSGTTGRPKGVRRPLLDIPPEMLIEVMRQTLMRHLGLGPGDEVHLAIGPLYHSAPCVHAMMALNLGHAVVVAPQFRPEHTLELIQRHGVTNTFMVPTMFHRMLALPDDVRARYDVSSLRQVFHSAAPVPVETKQRMMDWWGPVLYEYYGSTESGPVVVARPHDWLARPGTVGCPVDGVQIKILDPEGAELPPGETGLIYATGQPGFEYHGDPDKTASSMRGEYYTPGDLGHLDEDGWLYMSDRRTDLIISGGVNIYPAEIESALLQHPAVGDVVVIGVPDEDWGQSAVALVEPAEDAEPGDALAAELLAHCGPRLSKLKHPRRVEFRETLPRTPSGKLSRRRVREDYLREHAG